MMNSQRNLRRKSHSCLLQRLFAQHYKHGADSLQPDQDLLAHGLYARTKPVGSYASSWPRHLSTVMDSELYDSLQP